MMIMFGEYQILIFLHDKIIILTKPPLILMSGVVNTDNSRYIANRSNCTVQWVLEDNVWQVSGYDERS